jgi:HSP20 family protein
MNIVRWDPLNLSRWDPFRELEDMTARLNRLVGQPTTQLLAGDGFADWTPALDVEETDTEYLVKADLPEVQKEDVKVQVQDGQLMLEGERKQEREEQGKRFRRVERSYGSFMRRLSLPNDADAQKIAADFKNGVLNIHIPKSASAKPKAVEIKVS